MTVVAGLARNSAAPAGVLLRLLDAAPAAAARGLAVHPGLPLPVQEAMAAHPALAVRGALAERPDVDPAIRLRLLHDPHWRVAVRAFGRPGQPPLPDDVLSDLLLAFEQEPREGLYFVNELWGEVLDAVHYDVRPYRVAAVHADPRVRRHAAQVAYRLDEAHRAALLADPVPEVRAAAAAAIAEDERVMQPADLPGHHCHGYWAVLQRPLSRALIDRVLASGDVAALYYLGPNPSTPPDVVAALLDHPEAEVRQRLAARDDLTGAQLLRLAADPVTAVRTAVSVHPGLTEEQRARIAIDPAGVDGDDDWTARHPGRRVPPLAQALRWAGSVNPLLRRRAAAHPHLPPDLLAGDPDLGVRVLVARNNPQAPPELLLRSYLEYHGRGRERLRDRPGFPVAGLATFAGDPDPAVRLLATLDPQAPGEVVARLCADPDPGVRQAAAACPRLPVPRIVALLGDPELAGWAAANPALPPGAMERIVQSAVA